MGTPEFLIWALEYSCPIRGFQDGSDPERTERQLRAARAVGDAQFEGRVFEGLSVSPPDGFRIDKALEIYGGLYAVEQACGDCPANALAHQAPGKFAGCYGLVPLPDDPRTVHSEVERAIERAYPRTDWTTLCIATTPRWYGLWINSPLAAEQLLVRYLVLAAAKIDDSLCRAAVAELLAALNAAFDIDCRLHVRLFPRGHVDGPWWRLAPHCPRCKVPWNDASGQQCKICGLDTHPAPDKKRRARGRRPYYPLSQLLGEREAKEFIVRYQAHRARQERQPPARIQPRAEPQDSPPDD
jgi:hypothetical protein